MGRWRHVDATSDRPVYRQIADMLRIAINDSQLRPGEFLPSEAHLCEEFGAGRNSVRSALVVLRSEGLVVSEAGRGTRVREEKDAAVVSVPPGGRITSRMPTPEERRRLAIAEGIPVLVVERGGEVEVLPADRFAIETVPGDLPPAS
jgi:DNA-binding GntR family transcriptional regulator